MAQATAITLADGQATPVNVTFNPEQVTPAMSSFVDRATGVAAYFRRFTVRFKPAGGGRKETQTQYSFSLPVSGTLPSGAPGVVRTLRARVIYDLPDGCTDGERKDLHAFVRNGLAHALVQGAMRDNDPLY